MAKDYKDYAEFLNDLGFGKIDGVDVTHDGYPLNAKEAKFINLFVENGNLTKCLKDAGISYKSIAGKDYITDEIKYRLDLIKKQSIADADEILQYFTKVMRGEEKDQFGLDAPLAERTSAARELARRVVDVPDTSAPDIRVTLTWDDM